MVEFADDLHPISVTSDCELCAEEIEYVKDSNKLKLYTEFETCQVDGDRYRDADVL